MPRPPNLRLPNLRLPNVLVLVVIAVCGVSRPAHAYLDPASGSLIIQAVIAGIGGMLFLARTHLRRWLGFFKRKRVDATDSPTVDEPVE